MLKNNVEYQGHLKVNVMMLHVGEKVLRCEYEVNPLTNDKGTKLLQKSNTLMQTDKVVKEQL